MRDEHDEQAVAVRDRLRGFFSMVNAAIPGLKYLGFGFWNAWAYAGLRGFLWTDGVVSVGMEDVVVRYLMELAKVAIVVAMLLANRDLVNRLVNSTPFVIGAGALSSLGSAMLLLIGGSGPARPILTACAILLCSASIILLLKSAQLFALIRPLDSVRRLAESALATILVFFVLRGAPAVLAIGFYVLLFLISSCLLCLYNVQEVPRRDALEGWLEVRTIPHVNRLFFALFLVMFACQVGLTAYESSVGAASLGGAYSYTSFFAAAALCVAIIVLSVKLPPISLAKVLHPLAAVFVALFAISMLLDSPGILGMAVNEMYTLLIVAFLPAIWSYLSHQSKTSPVAVFGLGYLWTSASSMLGWFVGGLIAAMGPTSSWARVVFVVGLVLVFMVTLLFIAPQDLLAGIFIPIDADEAELAGGATGELQVAGTDAVAGEGIDHGMEASHYLGMQYGLTQREEEVLRLLALGLDNGAISERLTVSYYTVRAHVRNIYSKTDVHSRAELAKLIADASNKIGESGRGQSR